MQGSFPLNNIQLVGSALMRGVTLVLPTSRVQGLLPQGMRLGGQHLTPPGTHPLILFFYDILHAQMTIPTLLPDMTYFEHIVGVPFVDVTGEAPNFVPGGPFFFMPQVLLTDYLAVLGGRLFWGFAKDLANIAVTESPCETRFAVRALDGRPLVALEYQAEGDYQPLHHYPPFSPIRKILEQPLIFQVPLGIGPWFVASTFAKLWSGARMRPIRTVVHIADAYVPGLPIGRFPLVGRASGIDQSALGSYEFTTEWSLSLIYPTWLG